MLRRLRERTAIGFAALLGVPIQIEPEGERRPLFDGVRLDAPPGQRGIDSPCGVSVVPAHHREAIGRLQSSYNPPDPLLTEVRELRKGTTALLSDIAANQREIIDALRQQEREQKLSTGRRWA